MKVRPYNKRVLVDVRDDPFQRTAWMCKAEDGQLIAIRATPRMLFIAEAGTKNDLYRIVRDGNEEAIKHGGYSADIPFSKVLEVTGFVYNGQS